MHMMQRFDIDAVISMWMAVLAQQRIIISSSDVSLLTPLAECLLALIFPFR